MTSETALSAEEALRRLRDLVIGDGGDYLDIIERALAARSQPAREPHELTDYQRGFVDGFEAPVNRAARSQPATEERETFAAVNKALAYLDGEPSEMALAAARATLLSLRAALAATEPAGDEPRVPSVGVIERIKADRSRFGR